MKEDVAFPPAKNHDVLTNVIFFACSDLFLAVLASSDLFSPVLG
jgi:hypothetical protein